MDCKKFIEHVKACFEMHIDQVFIFSISILVLVVIVCLAYKLYKHRKIVRENSTYYKAILDLNEKTEYYHKIAQEGKLVHVLRVNSKNKYDKTDELVALYDYLGRYGREVNEYLQQVGENRRIYKAYNAKFESLSSMITPDECEKLKIKYEKFCKIEQNLVNAEKLDMTQEFSIQCFVEYTSPQGRNHYEKNSIFLESEIRTAIRNISARAEYMQTEAFRRKNERSKVTPSLRLQIIERDGRRCCICGRSVRDGATLEVDHILPVSKGGKTEYSNLQTLCRDCNRGKGAKI